MILDTLERANRYMSLHKGFHRAFEFLARVSEHQSGTIEIDGRNLYATISAQPGRPRRDAFLESHRKYIDVHYCMEGEEEIGWRHIEDCEGVRDPYDSEKDFMSYLDPPAAWIKLRPGMFAVFYPEDAHAPLVSGSLIRKAVVKVLL